MAKFQITFTFTFDDNGVSIHAVSDDLDKTEQHYSRLADGVWTTCMGQPLHRSIAVAVEHILQAEYASALRRQLTQLLLQEIPAGGKARVYLDTRSGLDGIEAVEDNTCDVVVAMLADADDIRFVNVDIYDEHDERQASHRLGEE